MFDRSPFDWLDMTDGEKLLEEVVAAVNHKPIPQPTVCPTCENPVVEVNGDGTVFVHHKYHTRKISLARILKLVRSEKGKRTLRRYALK